MSEVGATDIHVYFYFLTYHMITMYVITLDKVALLGSWKLAPATRHALFNVFGIT